MALKQSIMLHSEYCTKSASNNDDHRELSEISFIKVMVVRRPEI